MKRFLFLLLILTAVGILASCNLLNPVGPAETTAPVTTTEPGTTAPGATTTAPVTTDTPVTEPPVTEPPVTEAPVVYTGLLKDYQIVFAGGNEENREHAISLKELLAEKGLTVSVVSDFSYDGLPPYGFQMPRATEILIGNTARIEDDDATLPGKNYRIRVIGARILIEAGSSEAMAEAIEAFAASCLTGSADELTCTLTAETPLSFRSDEYNNLTIGTNLPTVIYAGERAYEHAKEISDFLTEYAGFMLEIREGTPAAGENAIFVDLDYLKYGGSYKLEVADGVLTLGAPTLTGMTKVCDLFLENIDGLKTGDLDVTAAMNATATFMTDIETVVTDPADYDNDYQNKNNHKGQGAEIIGGAVKNSLDYKSGDEVSFSLSLVYGLSKTPYACHSFKYTILSDTVDATAWATVSGASGEFFVTVPEEYTQDTGSIRLRVQAYDSKGNMIAEHYAGAYINREEITSIVAKPADYEEFWQARIQEVLDTNPISTAAGRKAHESNYFHYYKMDEEYMEASKNCASMVSHLDDFDFYEVFLKSPGYMPAVFYIAIPKSVTEQSSLPVFTSFNAYGARNGYISCNYNSYVVAIGPNGVPGVYYDEETDTYTEVDYSDYSTYDDAHKNYHTSFGLKISDYTNTATTAEAYLTQMLQRNIQVMRFLSDPDLTAGTPFEIVSKTYNGEMSYVGGSMGGFQSIAMAAIYEMIPATYTYKGETVQNRMGHAVQIDIRCPWFCDPIGMAGHPDRTAGLGTRIQGLTDYTQILGAAYLDSAYFGQYLKCEVKMVAGYADTTCPSTGIMAFYNSVSANITLAMTQNKDHSGTDPVTMVTETISKPAAE